MMDKIPDEAVQAAIDAHNETWNNNQSMDNALPAFAMRAALTAAAPHLAAVRVKKLIWRDNEHGSRCISDQRYNIDIWFEGGKPLYVDNYTTMLRFGTMDEAKAAAQASYEACILSALEPSAGRAAVPGELWVEGWYGSDPGKGAWVWSQTEYETRKEILFHVGKDEIHLELARKIVAAHNAAIRALSSPDHIADAGKVEGDGWLPIESAPTDETLFLAYCPADEDFPDGRMMIWKGSIFAFQKNPTPNHLQFPATHWRPLPSAPSEGAE